MTPPGFSAQMSDSIFALATPQGRSAVQIIRISGEQAAPVLQQLLGAVPPPRKAHYGVLRLSENDIIDQGLVLFFQNPLSATGEDMAELHLHGSPILGQMVLSWLAAWPGMRPAEAGEFTRRGFLNGKINLDQAEAVADIIDADTILQHQHAMRQLDGNLSRTTEDWREAIIKLAAQLEALIDFSDENLPSNVAEQIQKGAQELIDEMKQSLSTSEQGLIHRDGLRVAMMGRPNAGKSTLLNALIGDERAIVSPEAGTTRDLIQASLDVRGIAAHLIDTAGVRGDKDKIGQVEEEGIRRALQAAATAHIVIILVDILEDEPLKVFAELKNKLEIAASDGEEQELRPEILPILTKSDLKSSRRNKQDLPDWVQISLKNKSKKGLEQFNQVLEAKLLEKTSAIEPPILTRQRHIAGVEGALAALIRASEHDLDHAPELMAEEFRLAATALGRISGRVDVEDLLDHIFSSFCIGK